MSILNVNQIQPVGSGQTVTISATNISAGSATVTAGTFTGNLTGNVTGNVTSSSTSTFTNGLNVTGGSVGIGTDNPDEKFEVYGGKIKVDGGGNRWITIDPGSNTTYEPRVEGSHELVFRSYVASGSGVKTCTFTSNGDLDLTQGRNLKFASGNGIDFSATANGSGTTTSELLDDYEEGTWTPTIDLSVSSPTYSKQEGKYTKIGNVVNVSCTLAISSGTTDGSTFRVGGFPFSALNLNDRAFTGIVRVNSVSSNGEKLYVFMNANASTAFLNTQTATGSGGFTGNQFGTTGSISFSLTYIEA